MKMANMDSAFDFMFTSPKDDKGVSIILNFFLINLMNHINRCKGDGGRGGGGVWGSAVTVYTGSRP